MCGIAGIFHRDGRPASPVALKAMTDIIAHRGPDGEGHYRDGSIGLGHRRLSIIDLTDAARQPMATRDGRFVLTYNGEIYNFQELKAELSARGHLFHSSGDSQVLLTAFLEWGLSALYKLNGMFAFGIWDCQEKKLTIARDRFGVKPLYYTHVDGAFLFASEIKAFRGFPGFTSRMNIGGLAEYLTFQNFFSDDTLWTNSTAFSVRQCPVRWSRMLILAPICPVEWIQGPSLRSLRSNCPLCVPSRWDLT
jgi:asparagine synthase (glutamine-hydrolysing)